MRGRLPAIALAHALLERQIAFVAVPVHRLPFHRGLGRDVEHDRQRGPRQEPLHVVEPRGIDDVQRFLPRAALTIILDIAPETAAKRKSVDRDRYERDLALQQRVRESYRRQAAAHGWVVLDGERAKDEIAADVFAEVTGIVGQP